MYNPGYRNADGTLTAKALKSGQADSHTYYTARGNIGFTVDILFADGKYRVEFSDASLGHKKAVATFTNPASAYRVYNMWKFSGIECFYNGLDAKKVRYRTA